jgi:predicted amidophosphoribosyltransferase
MAEEAQLLEYPIDSPPIVVPVPNHWTHAFGGAADAAGSLARSLSNKTGWELNTRIVRRIRKTAKQGMLSWSERKQNVRGAFKISDAKQVTARHVIVVDDVLTTGATSAELSSRLKRAGAASVSVVVAARGTGARESSSADNSST